VRLPTDLRSPAAGVLAAVVALATTELAAGLLPGGRSLFVAVGDAIIERTPGDVVAFAIAAFGGANRLVLLGSMAVVVVVAGAFVGWLASRRRLAGVAGLAAFTVLGIAAAVHDPFIPALTAVVAPLTGILAGAFSLFVLLKAARPAEPAGLDDVARSRRAFLVSAGSTVGAAVAFAGAGQLLHARAAEKAGGGVTLPPPRPPLPPPPADAAFDLPGLSRLITPNDRFYRIDTALMTPRINSDNHVVTVTGMVERPVTLRYADLLRRATTEVDVTLACVSNEVGGRLVGNARWQGVPLGEVLDRAGVQHGATQIVGRSVDGWTAGFPVEAAFDGRPAVLAVGMNDEPLPREHGFPVRLVVAGLYGYVSATKWLSEIELTTFEDFDAYWVPRGWARFGPMKTQSRIDLPAAGARLAAGRVVVAGVAWAGERAVAAVEVGIDGQWRPAELAAELAETSWRQWRYDWDAEPGSHVVRVRATDGTGATQTAERSPARPDGATGHHTIEVRVT
jgi:DMSO/TMAO reductase YedYZ molybdopterin-dependent catalytic subunit